MQVSVRYTAIAWLPQRTRNFSRRLLPSSVQRYNPFVDPKQQLNHRRYLEALDRMTPEQRLKKAFELSDMTRRLVMQGIRQRFPDASPEQLRDVLLTILERCRNNNY